MSGTEGKGYKTAAGKEWATLEAANLPEWGAASGGKMTLR